MYTSVALAFQEVLKYKYRNFQPYALITVKLALRKGINNFTACVSAQRKGFPTKTGVPSQSTYAPYATYAHIKGKIDTAEKHCLTASETDKGPFK